MASEDTDAAIETNPFRISRTELGWLASEEYLRSFWWIVAAVPLFGVVAVAFGSGLLQVIGVMAVLWPFSIPARAVISTGKAAKLFTVGTRMSAYPDVLLFHRKEGAGMKLFLRDVRDVVRRRDYLVIRMRKFGIVPIPVSAFKAGDEEELCSMILAAIETRYAEAELSSPPR